VKTYIQLRLAVFVPSIAARGLPGLASSRGGIAQGGSRLKSAELFVCASAILPACRIILRLVGLVGAVGAAGPLGAILAIVIGILAIGLVLG
jgi:hypothetical protein